MHTKVKQCWLEMQPSKNESSNGYDDSSVSDEDKVVPLWKRLNTPVILAAVFSNAEIFSFSLEERNITK